MTQIQIRKASRKKARLRLGISAPSGAGKTLGALLLAYGITGDWNKIGIIDTEEGSGELYVGVHKHGVTIGEYAYLRVSAPFTVTKYLDSLHAMEAAGIDVIIIDSSTHAWSGAGGILDKQGKITDESKSKNSYYAWRQVTPEHNAFVDALLQSPSHIICTMRAKVEYAVEGAKVIKLGMAPVQREGMEYEFTVFFDINSSSIASASKDRTDLFSTIDGAGRLEKRQFIITPETGRELNKWLERGIESIESLAERMAADIKISIDLNKTWAEHTSTMARMHSERPEWVAMMKGLFQKRADELLTNSRSE